MATTLAASTVVAPHPSSFASLKRYVVDYVQGVDDAELLDVAGRAINAAVDMLNAERSWIKVNRKQTIYLVADQIDYNINTDFKDPIYALLLNTSFMPTKRLNYKDYKTLALDNPNAEFSGSPWVYTIFYNERLFSFVITPTQDFVSSTPYVELRYHNRLQYMTADSDTHGGPPEFNAFIGWQARFDVATARGESNLARLAEIKALRVLDALKMSDNSTETDWSEW